MTLLEFLTTLDSKDDSKHVYVNPYNIDDFVIRSEFFIAHPIDNKVNIGNLFNLSFGRQDFNKALWCAIELDRIDNKERNITDSYNILSGYRTGYLSEHYKINLESKAKRIMAENSKAQAIYFVEQELPNILKQLLK